ncbi:MAG: EMC3/TMCO1 family protein [Candidatus Hermodarchaeota archaeon]|nr:EMC3/TMCO1 family protein [Candidatus Hermodarchaeota archaeon]
MQNILIDIALGIRIAMGPWAYPPLSAVVVLLVSVAISLTSNLINRHFIDYERLGRARTEIKKWQDMKRQASQETDPKLKRKLDMKVKRRERYVMKLQTETSKQSFLPMMITIIPFMLVFAVMNGIFVDPFTYPGQAIPGPVLYSPLNFAQLLGSFGLGFGWQYGQWPLIPLGGMGLLYIYWYIICSFTMNLVIQKFLGTSMTTGM